MSKDAVSTNADSKGITTLQVDGGMTVNNLLMQRQADILQVTVCKPKCGNISENR